MDELISREAMLSLQTEYAEEMSATTFWKLRDDIRKLPSVTPERPKGKWIEVLEWRTEFSSAWHYECSECRAMSYKGFKPLERYCPNCGAEMEGEENV